MKNPHANPFSICYSQKGVFRIMEGELVFFISTGRNVESFLKKDANHIFWIKKGNRLSEIEFHHD